VAEESIGVYDTHWAAEVASARKADVGGAVIEPVHDGGRTLWRVKVIGRIGESGESLRARLASAAGAPVTYVTYVHHAPGHRSRHQRRRRKT